MALVALTVLREHLNAVGLSTVSITDSALSRIEAVAAARVEGYIERSLAIAWHTEHFDIENGSDTLFLKNFPLQSIAGITNDGSAVATGDYHSYSDEGMIKLDDNLSLNTARRDPSPNFQEGKHTVSITYQAGYTTIPLDIQLVVTNITGRILGGSGTSALSGERIGDYQYTRDAKAAGASGGFTADDLVILNRYRPQFTWFEVSR